MPLSRNIGRRRNVFLLALLGSNIVVVFLIFKVGIIGNNYNRYLPLLVLVILVFYGFWAPVLYFHFPYG